MNSAQQTTGRGSAVTGRGRPDRHRRARTPRRLTRAAMFAAVRGAAYAGATALIDVIHWWLTHR